MKIRERFEKRIIEDTKERFFDNRLTPVLITVVTTVIVMRFCTKQPKIIVNLNVNSGK